MSHEEVLSQIKAIKDIKECIYITSNQFVLKNEISEEDMLDTQEVIGLAKNLKLWHIYSNIELFNFKDLQVEIEKRYELAIHKTLINDQLQELIKNVKFTLAYSERNTTNAQNILSASNPKRPIKWDTAEIILVENDFNIKMLNNSPFQNHGYGLNNYKYNYQLSLNYLNDKCQSILDIINKIKNDSTIDFYSESQSKEENKTNALNLIFSALHKRFLDCEYKATNETREFLTKIRCASFCEQIYIKNYFLKSNNPQEAITCFALCRYGINIKNSLSKAKEKERKKHFMQKINGLNPLKNCFL